MFLLYTNVVSEQRNIRVDRADPRPIRNAPIAAAALVHRIIVVTRSGHHQALRRDCWRARRHGERSNAERISRPSRQNQALCKAPFGLGLARLRRIH